MCAALRNTRYDHFSNVIYLNTTALSLVSFHVSYRSSPGANHLEYLPSQIRIHRNVMMGFSDYSFVNIRFSIFAIRPAGNGKTQIGQRVPQGRYIGL